jgi:hypothetical protein
VVVSAALRHDNPSGQNQIIYLVMKTLIWGIIGCFFCSACNPEDCPAELLYELPFSLSNPSDTISVGDTLWYESKFDKVLIDKIDNIENEFRDYDFSFLFCYLTKIDSSEEQGGGLNIEILNEIGNLNVTSVSFGYDYYHLNFDYNQQVYHLRYGLILKEPGLFTVQIGYLNTEKKVKTNCTRHPVLWHFLLNETDTNFEMLQTSPIPFWQNYKRSDWDRLASYCVYVRP